LLFFNFAKNGICIEPVTYGAWYFCKLLNLMIKFNYKKCIKFATVIFIKATHIRQHAEK